MIEIGGQDYELRFTVQVTRAETGKVEEFEVVGSANAEQIKQLQADGLITSEE